MSSRTLSSPSLALLLGDSSHSSRFGDNDDSDAASDSKDVESNGFGDSFSALALDAGQAATACVEENVRSEDGEDGDPGSVRC